MQWVDVGLNAGGPKLGEVRIKHKAIGVNYIDTYHRSGLYPTIRPCVLGLEAVGEIVALAGDVEDLSLGDRVGYASAPIGAYSEERDFPANKVIKIPDLL